jgi:hypothetical protein
VAPDNQPKADDGASHPTARTFLHFAHSRDRDEAKSDRVLRSTPFVALVTVCSKLALEKRNGNLYYYRHVRDGDRVRKIYVGSGEIALLAHEHDLIKRAAEEHKWNEEREEREKFEALASSVEELRDVAEILTRAYLIASGYRRYQGHWRLKRSE